jgi:acyl-coenzyme A thioesterase PaaI-like protein
VTSSYTLHFLGPALGERLRAKGRVIRAGKRQVTVQADIFAEEGEDSKLVATALATIARVER